MAEQSTEDILLTICAQVAAFATICSNLVFFTYVIYKIIFYDLRFKPHFDTHIKHPILRALRIHTHSHSDSKVKMINGKATQRRRFKRGNSQRKIFFNRNMRFLCMLQFSTLGAVLADAYVTLPVSTVPALCMLQSVQMQIFNWFVFSWSSNVAFYLFYSIMFPRMAQNRKILNVGLEIAAHAFALLTATVFTTIPLATGTFGEAGGWCWITDRAQQMGTFYGPLWFLIMLDILIYATVLIKIVLTIRKTIGLKKSLQSEQQLKTTLKLVLYPGIFVLVWTVPTCNRVLGLFKISHISLSMFHIFITCLQGTFNVFTYFLNPIGHLRLLRRIFCWPCLLVRSTQSGQEFHNHAESFTNQIAMLARDTDSEDDASLIESDRATALLDNDYGLGGGPAPADDSGSDHGDSRKESFTLDHGTLPESGEAEGFLSQHKHYDNDASMLNGVSSIDGEEAGDNVEVDKLGASLLQSTPNYSNHEEADILFLGDEEHVEDEEDSLMMGASTPPLDAV